MQWDAFIGGFGRSQSPIADCETLQNLYVQAMSSPGAKSGAVLYPTPGFEEFGRVSQAGAKRIFSTAASSSRVFAVIGSSFCEVMSNGSVTVHGAVAVDANPATMVTNGDGGQQLGITAGGNFYCFDLLTNTLTQVVFLNGKATQCGFVIGYFLVFDINTGTVYQSDLYDGLTFDPLNFFQRSVQADDWNGMFVAPWGQIFLPGTKTRDNYYNAGTFPIPFAPSQSGTLPEGLAATFSLAAAGSRICWLGTTAEGGYKVFATSGYEAITISDEAIDYALSQFTDAELASATGETYTDQGHDFYLLYVGNTTFGFDFQSGVWHTRRTFVDAVSGQLGPWRAKWHCFGFSKHLWLDSGSGAIYEADITFTTDVDGLLIQRQRTSPSICKDNQVLDIGEFELKMQTGVGNANAPGNFPTVWLEISTDGGMTWGRQRSASVGRIGQYGIRVRWQGNGSGRDVAFRLTMTDPVNNWRIIAAYLEMADEQGRGVNLMSRKAAA